MITLATGISIYLWTRSRPTELMGVGSLMLAAMVCGCDGLRCSYCSYYLYDFFLKERRDGNK
jgi:hypothetical protein